jgi:hypothetical protein
LAAPRLISIWNSVCVWKEMIANILRHLWPCSAPHLASGGQCYDRDFRRFSAGKMTAFLESPKIGVFWVKNVNFFINFFPRNYLQKW